MGLLKSFKGFAQRVLNAVEGKLGAQDTLLLVHLLEKTSKRNLVLARGLLTALNVNSPKKEDVQTIAKILDQANLRIIKDKEPFSPQNKKTLSKIFLKYGLSQKVADWVSSQNDIFLYKEITEICDKETGVKKVKMGKLGKKKLKA